MKSKIGWVLSALVAALLFYSAYGKFTATQEMLDISEKAGIPGRLVTTIGILETLATVLFLIPQTAFFGVILVTGYMGGAILQHFRQGEPIFIQLLVPIIAWIGFGLRNYEGTIKLIKNKG